MDLHRHKVEFEQLIRIVAEEKAFRRRRSGGTIISL